MIKTMQVLRKCQTLSDFGKNCGMKRKINFFFQKTEKETKKKNREIGLMSLKL